MEGHELCPSLVCPESTGNIRNGAHSFCLPQLEPNSIYICSPTTGNSEGEQEHLILTKYTKEVHPTPRKPSMVTLNYAQSTT